MEHTWYLHAYYLLVPLNSSAIKITFKWFI